MQDQTIQNGQDLARAIRKAPPGARVELSYGEFQGPFLLDKPITIVGQGDGTSLYGQSTPAFIVLSKGVRIESLSIADAFDSEDGTSLLFLDLMGPDLVKVTIYGRMVRMAQEQVIDLGLAQTKQTVHSFLEVEVSGPTEIKQSDTCARWLSIHPSRLETAGKHMLQFSLNAKDIGEEALVLGSFNLVTGGSNQTMWVMARIVNTLPKKPFANIALMMPRSCGARFSEAFVIGKNKFPNQAAASTLDEKQAFIYKDDGVWSIYQPYKVRAATQVNNVALVLGQRQVLNEGDVIRAGGFELKVEAPTGSPDLSINKPTLNLAGAGKTSFILTFNGKAKEKIKIYSTVPWLQATPNEVELTRGGTKEIEVTLFSLGIKPGRLNERGAIMIVSDKEMLSIDASAEVLAEVVRPVCSEFFDFKTVSDWTSSKATVKITNQGSKEWKAKVQSDREWISPEQTEVVIAAGATISLNCKLNQKIETLALQGNQEGILQMDGDGAHLPIKVKAFIQLPTIEPELISPSTALIDFKDVQQGSQGFPATLILKNKGRKEWQPAIKILVPWLEVSERSFILAGGGQKSLIVQVTDKAPVGKHSINPAIVIEGQGKQINLQVNLLVSPPPPPTIEINPTALNFGVFSNWRDAAPQQMSIKNIGTMAWEGRITNTIPWVDIFPLGDKISIGPGSETTLTFRTNSKIVENKYQIPAGIILEGSVGSCPISVQAEYKLEMLLSLSATKVDFGEIEPGGKIPPKKLTLKNKGGKDAVISVKVDPSIPWLSAGPLTLSIPKGEAAEVEICITDNVEKTVGMTRVEKAVQLACAGFEQWIEVAFTISEARLQLDMSEITFRLNEGVDPASAGQAIIVTNISHRAWQGSIASKDSCVSVTPTSLNLEPGNSASVIISPNAEVWKNGLGEKFLGRIITFEKTAQSIGVWVTIKKNEPARLEINPSKLDFGQVNEETCKDQIQHLVMKSKRPWEANLEFTTGNWFESEVKTLRGNANQLVTVNFRLNENFQSRKPGVYWGEVRVVSPGIECPPVPVRVEKVEIPFLVECQPTAAELILPTKDKSPLRQRVIVQNKSTKGWDLNLSVSESWLKVEPARLSLPAAAEGEFEIWVGNGESLENGEYQTQVTLQSGRNIVKYPIQVAVGPATWEIAGPQYIAFDSIVRDAWNNVKPQKLQFINISNKPIELLLKVTKGEEWLEIPARLNLPAGEGSSKEIEVRLAKGGGDFRKVGRNEAMIEITGAGHKVRVPVMVTIRSGDIIIEHNQDVRRVDSISVSPNELTFDLSEKMLKDWENIPAQFVRLTNHTGAEITVNVMVKANLLSVEPANQVLLSAGEWKEIAVRIKQNLFNRLTPGEEVDLPDAIQIGSIYGSQKIRLMMKWVAESSVHPIDLIKPTRTTDGPMETTKVVLTTGTETLVKSPPIPPSTPDGGDLDIFPPRLILEWAEGCTRVLTITNRGKTPLVLKIQTLKWLQVQGSPEVVCQPGSITKLTFAVTQNTPFRPIGEDPRGILIDCNGYVTPVAVALET